MHFVLKSRKPGDLKGMQISKEEKWNQREKHMRMRLGLWLNMQFSQSEEAKDMDLLLNTWASFSSFVVEAAVLIRTQSAQVFHHYILPFSLLTQSCSLSWSLITNTTP
jgi:hypothetical protein